MSNITTAKQDLRSLITGDKMKREFQNALPKILPVDRFLRCLMTTVGRNPDLLNCDKDSVLACAMTAAQLGLEIDPALGRAYLIPFKGKATLVIGYKGFIDLAYRSGQVSGFQAEAVYEADEFSYSLGLTPTLKHVPADLENRGALKYAYAVANLSNGGTVWRVLNRAQVMKHKASAAFAESPRSPWKTHEEEMWRKTAIRALSSTIPQSPELQRAVASEDMEQTNVKWDDAIDATSEHVNPMESLAKETNVDPAK
jgi:recombination protein RecT